MSALHRRVGVWCERTLILVKTDRQTDTRLTAEQKAGQMKTARSRSRKM